jgi:outer membrane lipoprotein
MKWFIASLILLLSGCSGLPTVMRDTSYSNTRLSAVKMDISAYQNMSFRWGGTVINVINKKDSSQIQVLYYPISRYGRPLTDRKTEGRFVITSPQFLDPAIFKEGTAITVTGVLSGEIKQQVGEKTLTLPLLTIDNIHIWTDYSQTDDGFYPRHYYYPYYRYDPFYNHFHYNRYYW